MSQHKVYVLDPYHPDAIQTLRDAAVDLVIDSDTHKDRWRDEAEAILVRSTTRITAADIAQVKRLKVIVKQGAGVDNIDLDAAKGAGIAVCNTPALNSETVAELTLTLALSIARRIPELDHRLRRGETIVRAEVLGQSLFQKTIGIVGMGNIGKIVAQKWLGAMSGRIVVYDPVAPLDRWPDIPHQRAAELDELLRTSDVISLHVPLIASTRGMIAKPQFSLMKKNAILINCARGGIVDEDALLEALETKGIFGAALDAMNFEPPTLAKYETLLKHDTIILTPHVGASTAEMQSISGVAAAQTILKVLGGEEVPNRLV